MLYSYGYYEDTGEGLLFNFNKIRGDRCLRQVVDSVCC